MNAAEHLAQRDAVRASLACTHHPDTYSSRSISRTGEHARPADEDGRVSAVPLRDLPSHGARPEEAGRDGWAAHPTRPDALLADCGVCVLIPDSDPMTGQYDLIEQASCPTHGWDQHPVMRTVRGAPRIV